MIVVKFSVNVKNDFIRLQDFKIDCTVRLRTNLDRNRDRTGAEQEKEQQQGQEQEQEQEHNLKT